MAKSLYICYFGVREPLVQTQVLPYLRELQKDDSPSSASEPRISLLTFERDRSLDVESMRSGLAADGIDWHWLPYHKRFSMLATAWDILRGTIFIRRFIAQKRPDILHCRVHVPALMGALARKLSRNKPKLLFDIRGFFPEEYVDAGVWRKNGLIYRGAKAVERWLFDVSDGFVVLTEKARDVLFPGSSETGVDKLGRPVAVIPCCVDLDRRFTDRGDAMRSTTRKELGIENRFVITHVGALGGLYLQNEIADFLAAARTVEPKVFSIFLTQTSPDLIVPLLRERGFGESDFLVTRVGPLDVQRFLEASDVGLSFVKASFATLSRSPTKIPEYLACGVPIIANKGVGDVDDLISRSGVGAIVEDFETSEYVKALQEILNGGDKKALCRKIAKDRFDLAEVGGKLYRNLYRRLTEKLI